VRIPVFALYAMEKHLTSPKDLHLGSPEFSQLVGSKPFYDRFRSEIGKKILYEVQLHDPITVEHEVDDATLQAILEHIQQVWTRLGAEKPHWSVVSTSDYKPDKINETIAQFHQSGKSEVANFSRLLARVGISIPKSAVALEYGCGVGRVTRWLASKFDRVVGVDVSANHLAEARKYLAAESVANVETVHVSRASEIEALPAFDVLYSKIVLQHNPPPIMARVLNVLCGKLRPQGVGVVQIPTYACGYSFRAKEYLKTMSQQANMEMHVLPQPVVFNILDSNRCVPLEVSRDHLVKTVDFVSTTFVFQKRR
jgi:trans-aconitate methyltransferase